MPLEWPELSHLAYCSQSQFTAIAGYALFYAIEKHFFLQALICGKYLHIACLSGLQNRVKDL